MTDDIREASDESKATVLTLLDFTKAFDSVNIDSLLKKLRNLHLSDSTLTWFVSYLRGRKQCVISDNRFSSWRNVIGGSASGICIGTIVVHDLHK